MKRRAFQMKLKSGFVAEYKKRHDELWPEISAALKEAGVVEYSIFFDEDTSSLFAFQILTDNNTVMTLRDSDIMRKWWIHLADIMEGSPDSSPVTRPLPEVFHLG
jgi:L-rhamnose mutarotase